MIKKINIQILSIFKIGYSRYAPGTVASFITCLFYIFLFSFNVDIKILILLVSITFVYSVIAIDKMSKFFLEVDAKEIVIDEFVGQSIPLLTMYYMLPQNNFGDFLIYSLISLFLFRIFDILKPFPINLIDKKMKNGFGVMFDDIIAGFYSVLILLIFFIFINNYV